MGRCFYSTFYNRHSEYYCIYRCSKEYIHHDEISETVLKLKLDEKLKILNDDYRVERISALKDVLVEIVPPRIFYSWMQQHGKVGAQNKFPRVMKKKHKSIL